MEEKIITHIEQVLTNEDIEDGLEVTDDLLGSGILDSIGMMKLITFLEDSFTIKVDPEDMVIENFMTVENVVDFIKTKK